MTMRETSHGELLPDDHHYTIHEVCILCRVDQHWVFETVEHGVIESPIDGNTHFSQSDVDRLIRAVRMQRAFEIHMENIALVLDLMDTIEAQRHELALLKRQTDSGWSTD